MSRLLEFFLGSILIAAFTVALMFFSVLQYVLRISSSVDCTWRASARTWIDANGNGQMDRGELPLGGVQIHVNDLGNQLVNVAWPVVADRDGEAPFHAPIPECSDTLFEIYVDVPEGYRLTTSSRVEVTPDVWEGLTAKHVYYFGFVPDN
ncbi:MAG TPA: hypothetical protein VFQ13_19135 [Anaerolineales bacterium]|nr:hypothetical protein [Anaerolineales bacterium]